MTCERALRDLFVQAYQQAYGSTWLSSIATPEKIAKWQERRDEEVRHRATRGVMTSPGNELSYAEFHELCAIAHKHWQPLAPALGKRAVTHPLLLRFEGLRNTVAHSRPVLLFEAELLSGIAGEIRNRVTIYMTGQDPTGEYYARIESVTDSFGTTVDQLGEDAVKVASERVRVAVGDVLAFECRGTDAQGRLLHWSLAQNPSSLVLDSSTGDHVTLRWTVEASAVGIETLVVVHLVSDGDYHRRKGKDGSAIFRYEVPPP